MNKKLILITCIVVLFGWFSYYYVSGLPHYTFYLIYKSIRSHDVESFYKYVDVDSIINNFMDGVRKQALQKEESTDKYSFLGVGITQLMKPMLTDLAKQEITNAIEDIKQPAKQGVSVEETPVKYFMNRFKSLKQFSNIKIRISGKITEVEIPSHKKEESLILKMRKTPQRYWKIVAIQIPFISDENTKKEVKLEEKNTIFNNPVYSTYYQIIKDKVSRRAYENYNLKEVGEVFLNFTLLSNGEVKNIKIEEAKSTSNKRLIEIAINSVKDVSPFPSFPDELKQYPELSFNVVLSFDIE